MKKIWVLFFGLLHVLVLIAQPKFDLIGYATLNGGTTGGLGGTEINVSTFEDLKKYAEEKENKYIIYVNGTIKGKGKVEDSTYKGSIKVASNKSIIGKSDAFLDGVGLLINNSKNIVIKNLKISLAGVKIPSQMDTIDIPDIYSAKGDEGRAQILVNDGDCISIKGTSTNIWVDHCEIYNEDPEKQKNIDLYDGLLDIKNQSSFITISWCYFHDHHKCHLVGSSDKDNFDRKVTFHHNFYQNIDQRLPSNRFGKSHVFNNYYHDILVSGINSRMGACVKVEKNYFENVKDAIGTHHSKEVGAWQTIDNFYENCSGTQDTTSNCTLEKAYEYSKVLTKKTKDVKKIVLQHAGVGKL